MTALAVPCSWHIRGPKAILLQMSRGTKDLYFQHIVITVDCFGLQNVSLDIERLTTSKRCIFL